MEMLTAAVMMFAANSPVKGDESAGDPDPFPPTKYPVVVFSTDKAFRLEKLVGEPPVAVGDDYSCEADRASKLIKVKDKAGADVYEIPIPDLATLNQNLVRESVPEAFQGVTVTRSGNLVFCYYESNEFYYSRVAQSFTYMPGYVKDGEKIFQCGNWAEFAEDLFLTPISTRFEVEKGVAVYNAKTNKVYKLQVPAILDNLVDEWLSLRPHDSSQGLVHAVKYEKSEYGRDLDEEMTGDIGYHKIVGEAPAP
ncbi:MAG: hypothetical protein J0M04_07495 [Verrucomicrobia bacterium]|nr:hypothetical protein [Verrucomicrobiota bacterium]